MSKRTDADFVFNEVLNNIFGRHSKIAFLRPIFEATWQREAAMFYEEGDGWDQSLVDAVMRLHSLDVDDDGNIIF